ncbi:DUF2486 family protein [Paraburkholderia fungorum]|uniref:DUF2486 family protein n=1 Tax=Paraburkholderia fungorum TaxID=134537 RepID=UPI0038BC2100
MSDPNDSSIPVLHEVLVPGDPAQARLAPDGAAAPAAQPVPDPVSAQEPAFAQEPVHAPEPAHPKKRSKSHHPHADARHAHEPAFAPSAGVFDRAEPHAPVEAGTIVPPDLTHGASASAHSSLDADGIAERLRGRFAGFLTGEGRGIIEARCRDALQDHTAWLVNQITREVALALETEMTGWVREAVEEEIARRQGRS